MSYTDNFSILSPETPNLLWTSASVFGTSDDPVDFTYGGTSYLPSGRNENGQWMPDVNPEDFAAFPKELYDQGLVAPGTPVTVLNPATKKKVVVIARHAKTDDSTGIDLAPHSLLELGSSPDKKYVLDLKPVRGYPVATYPSPQMQQGTQEAGTDGGDLSQVSLSDLPDVVQGNDSVNRGGAGGGSAGTGSDIGTKIASGDKDEIKSRNEDGSITFTDGMTIYPDGHYEHPVNHGKDVAVWMPGATKPTFRKAGSTTDLTDVMKKKAAEKGIVRENFKTDDEYMQAMKSALGAGEASDIADAIMRGDQPPNTQGLYRQGPLVRAELARRGYDLQTAQNDWNATQKYIAASNSTPMFKLRASAQTAYHSLDIIDELASQWKANAHLPILNKANIIAGKNGAYGPEAASIANQLDGQIADVTSELANVYMGGGTPTDHSIELAKKGLSSEWDEHILHDMTTLARKNLEIRLNSLKTVGPALPSQAGSTPTPSTASPTPAPSVSTLKPGSVIKDKSGRLWKLKDGGDPRNPKDYLPVQ